MIPSSQALIRLIKAKGTFFLYGARATGKTTKLKDLFEDAEVEYIYLNCTMGDKKANFLKYLNHQLQKFFKKKIKQQNKNSKQIVTKYEKPADPSSVHVWSQNIKNLDIHLRNYLNGVYFFIDNIQEINLSTNFLSTFYTACQEDLEDLKIPFVFCGINLPKKIYAIDKPFRNIISYCMRKPTQIMESVIKKQALQVFHKKFIKNTKLRQYEQNDVKTAAQSLAQQIYFAFEPMQTNLTSLKKMSYLLSQQIAESIQNIITSEQDLNRGRKKPQYVEKSIAKRVHKIINTGSIRQYTKHMLQQQSIGSLVVQRQIKSQAHGQETETQLLLQYYPNLLITSLHQSDLAPEGEDKRRFQDYKNEKGKAMSKASEFRMIRHNLQRIIAISQTLESASCKEKCGPQKKLQHHSIFYYACFDYLREEEKINFLGKNYNFSSSKVHGQTRQEDAKTFLKTKMDLDYSQFDPSSRNMHAK